MKKKSLFCRTWFDRGILLVGQLLNKDGLLISYSEFLQNCIVTPKEYAVVFDAIPTGSLQILKQTYHSQILGLNLIKFLLGI